MKVFIIEYDHKHGTEIWVAKTQEIAEETVRAIKRNLYRAWVDDDDENAMTLQEAMDDWPGFTGDTEFFRINETVLIENINQARGARA